MRRPRNIKGDQEREGEIRAADRVSERKVDEERGTEWN